MSITQLISEGGIVFMLPLMALGLLIFCSCMYHLLLQFSKNKNPNLQKKLLKFSNEGSLFALVFGVLGQLIGLYLAFGSISEVGGVAPEILFAGLKANLLPTLTGLTIFVFGKLYWLLSTTWMDYNN